MQITSRLSEALGRFLDTTTAQMQVTASNMANVDTPGFKTQGLDFRQAFSGALKFGLANTGEGGASHISTQGPRTVAVDGLVARPDGNNVSMDREGLQLAKSQLEFRTGVELLKREYARTMSAIHADGK